MEISELKDRLIKLDTAVLCDANKGIRVMDPGIKPLRAGLKLFGIAHTVSCKDDFLTVLKALAEAGPGEVLVVDGQLGTRAMAGALFSTEALHKGLAGLVVDGAMRDSATIAPLALPVYCRLVSPMAGTSVKLFETQIPIHCGGVDVRPGEILFGDDDGIVVETAVELSKLLPIAEEIQRKEQVAFERMAAGQSLVSVLNLDEHIESIRSGRESRLEFR